MTGGYVYLGDTIPELADQYLCADYTSGRIWALKLPSVHLPAKGLVQARMLGQWPLLIATFGRAANGELYVADYGKGGLYRIAGPSSVQH